MTSSDAPRTTDMSGVDLTDERWFKSRFSGGGNDCVEVAFLAESDDVAVRDSKDPGAGALRVSAGEWADLMSAARSGALNVPRSNV